MTTRKQHRPPVARTVVGAATQVPRPPIERIRAFGTSWYRRGPRYWTMRVVIVLLLFIVLCVASVMTFGLGYGVWRWSVPVAVRVVVLALAAAAIVRSSVKAWGAFIRMERAERSGRALTLAEAGGDRTDARTVRRRGMAGTASGVAAGFGSVASGGLLVISAVFNFGWFIVMFVSAFRRYYGEEYSARVRLQDWCDAHGVPDPLT